MNKLLSFLRKQGVLIALILMTISALNGTVRLLLSKKDDLAKARREFEEVKKEHEKLIVIQQEINSTEYLEREARDKLGLAKPGETVVVLPSDDILKRLSPSRDQEEQLIVKPIWRRWLELFFR